MKSNRRNFIRTVGTGAAGMAIFNSHGIRTFWVLSDGGHEWANWRR